MHKIFTKAMLIFSLCIFSANAISAQIHSRRYSKKQHQAVYNNVKKTKKAYRKHVAKPIKKQRQQYRRYKCNQTNHSITEHLPPMCATIQGGKINLNKNNL